MSSSLPPLATPREVIAALGRGAAGAAMLGVGWYQASDRFQLDDQAPWLALAIAGLLVAAGGGVGWILVLRRRVADQLALVRGTAATLVGTMPEPAPDVDGVVVLRSGSPTLFHRPGCPLTQGRPVRRTDQDAALASGRERCGACHV